MTVWTENDHPENMTPEEIMERELADKASFYKLLARVFSEDLKKTQPSDRAEETAGPDLLPDLEKEMQETMRRQGAPYGGQMVTDTPAESLADRVQGLANLATEQGYCIGSVSPMGDGAPAGGAWVKAATDLETAAQFIRDALRAKRDPAALAEFLQAPDPAPTGAPLEHREEFFYTGDKHIEKPRPSYVEDIGDHEEELPF